MNALKKIARFWSNQRLFGEGRGGGGEGILTDIWSNTGYSYSTRHSHNTHHCHNTRFQISFFHVQHSCT